MSLLKLTVLLLLQSVAASPARSRHHRHTPADVATTTTSVTVGAVTAVATVTAVSSSGAVSAVPTPSPVASTNITNKRGVAYNDVSLTNLFTGKASWAYNWGSSSGGKIPSGMTYFPLLWSDSDGFTGSWNQNAASAIDSGADTLLGFNEPDIGSQANMPVSQAVTSWKKYMEPFSNTGSGVNGRKARLASPAVTNGGGDMGLTYLQNFITSCTGCHIDVVAIHWYSPATAIDNFKQHVTQAGQVAAGRPVWITEFATTSGTDDEINAFFTAVLPWLDQQSFVERYAYFMAGEGSLVSGGKLSTIGNKYVAA
jgi:hypothetical protein